jgi:hypothetical protein
MKRAVEWKICAYGFDKIGFSIPTVPARLPGRELHFVGFQSASRFEEYDGIIVPQGIFESFHTGHAWGQGDYTEVRYDKAMLLERERQVRNLFSQDKWICFLVDKIIDKAGYLHYEQDDVSDTDLCKRVLNGLGMGRKRTEGAAYVEATQSEFDKYIKKYGVAKTIFLLPVDREPERRVLARIGDLAVGIEVLNLAFFLPFHSTHKTQETANEIVELITEAVLDYRQKNAIPLPGWLDEMRFEPEKRLAGDLALTLERLAQLQTELQEWKLYKAVLTTSGENLKTRINLILESYFGMKVDPTDEGREDGKILDDDGRVLAFFEVKGIKKGVSREHINQVDSHRERAGVDSSISGVLFINNQMDLPGIEARQKTSIVEEHIRHAAKLGVIIIRTIDLLYFMKHVESKPEKDRKGELLRFLKQGGGWLMCGPAGCELVQR